MREGAAAGPLPERSAPPDQPAAAAAGRHLRGDRLGHGDLARWRRRLAQVRDTHGGASIFYFGGGGQGNHLGGAYSGATMRALGGRYRSNALAQEKTGEFWVNARLLGTMVRGDMEHAEVALFIGKNPWQSHGIPHARTTLKEIARDPDRALIVIDPRRSETAELADFHLAVRPGTDAWCLAALVAVLVQEGLVARVVARRAHGRARRHRSDLRRRAGGRLRGDVRRRRGAAAGDGAPHRQGVERGRLRGPRHPDEPPLDAGELSGEAALAADRQLRQAGHAVLAHRDGGAGPRRQRRQGRQGRQDEPGRRCPHHRWAGALQRHRRGDPDRPSGPVPGHGGRERQPRPLAGRQHAACGRRWRRWTWWWSSTSP